MKYILRFVLMWVGGIIALSVLIAFLPVKISDMVLTYISIAWLLVCVLINFVLLFRGESE